MGPVLHSSSPLVKFPGVVDHLTESHSKRLCKPGPCPLPQRASWAGPGSDLGRLLRALKNPSRVMGIPLRAKYLSVELPAVLFCQTPRHGPLVQGSPNFPAPDSPDTCARSIPSFSLALCISNTEDLPNALTPPPHCSPHPHIFAGKPLSLAMWMQSSTKGLLPTPPVVRHVT